MNSYHHRHGYHNYHHRKYTCDDDDDSAIIIDYVLVSFLIGVCYHLEAWLRTQQTSSSSSLSSSLSSIMHHASSSPSLLSVSHQQSHPITHLHSTAPICILSLKDNMHIEADSSCQRRHESETEEATSSSSLSSSL